MDAYLYDRSMIPSDNLVELKMDDFIGDIAGHMSEIYQKFGLGDYCKISSHIDNYLTENPEPSRKPHPPKHETIRLVDQYASTIMQNLGYTQVAPDDSSLQTTLALFHLGSNEKSRKSPVQIT